MTHHWLGAVAVLAAMVGGTGSSSGRADDAPAAPTKCRVTGLFSPDRVADLKKVMGDLLDIVLLDVDYKTSEATFRFDAAKAFPGARPEQIIERLDERLRNVSRSTFGARPLSTAPREKLKLVEIGVVGLDCKGCALAAYETVYKLEGVEQATASFKEGLITAWIDPEKTTAAVLSDALKKRGVELKPQP